MQFFSCGSYDTKNEDVCINENKSQLTNRSFKSIMSNDNFNKNDLDKIQTNDGNDDELEVIDYPYISNNFPDFTKRIFNNENHQCFLSLRKPKNFSNVSNKNNNEQTKEILENQVINELSKNQTKLMTKKNFNNNNLNNLVEDYEEEDTIKDQTSRAIAPLKNVIDNKKNYILINNNISNTNQNLNNKQKKIYKDKNNNVDIKKISHSPTGLITAINNGDYSCNNYFQSTDSKFNLKLSVNKNNNANKKIIHSIRKRNNKLYDTRENTKNKNSRSMKNVSLIKKNKKIISKNKNLVNSHKNKSLGKIIFKKYNNNRKSIKNENFINSSARENNNNFPIVNLMDDFTSRNVINNNRRISTDDRNIFKNNSEINIKKKIVKSYSISHMKILKNKGKN